jgi:20S proteasome alpha/beta subunit
MEKIISNDYTIFDNLAFESQMTLILGARCRDGVVLVGDRKMTQTDTGGIHNAYDDKITGEIDGILTAFSGDAGTFQVFVNTLRDYVTTTRDEQIKNLIGIYRAKFGPSFEQLKLRVSELQSEFNKKYEKYPYKVLMGVSSQYFPDRKSLLYHFYADGRFFSLSKPIAIGSGSSHVYYFLERYWDYDKTTMQDFAQLSDFLIRYVSHDKITLDNAVGLSPEQHIHKLVLYPTIQIFVNHIITETQNWIAHQH